jgi:hypothetical protein
MYGTLSKSARKVLKVYAVEVGEVERVSAYEEVSILLKFIQ